MDGSIGGLFLVVKGYMASKSRNWRCGQERGVERCPSFREIGSPCDRVTRQEGIFERHSDRPLLHAFFDEACRNIDISGAICGTIEVIIAKRK